jgi:uncharacterized protein HemX
MTRTNLLLAALAAALVAGTAFAYGPRTQAAAPAAATRDQVRQQLHEPGTAEPAEMNQLRQQLHEPGAAAPAEATQTRERQQTQDGTATATRQQLRQQVHDPAECDAEDAGQARVQRELHRAEAAGPANPDAPGQGQGRGQGRGTPRGGRS